MFPRTPSPPSPAFAPFPPSFWRCLPALVVGVAVQEAGRIVLGRLHGVALAALRSHVRQSEAEFGHVSGLSTCDEHALAATHGLMHGAVNALVINAAWLPYTSGDGTLYARACHAMSVFTVGAWSTLALCAILTCCSVLALRPSRPRGVPLAPPVMHLLAALLVRLRCLLWWGGEREEEGSSRCMLCLGTGWDAAHASRCVPGMAGVTPRVDASSSHTHARAHTRWPLQPSQTLVNLYPGGCRLSIPLLLVGAGAASAFTTALWWRDTKPAL